MVAFTKINDFTEDLGNEIHNLTSDSLQLALSNTAPASEGSNPTADGNGVVANVTQIAYTNVSGGQPTLASVTWTLSAGVATLDAADEIILASGGAVPTFRYVYLFNNTAAAKNIIGLWDAGATIDLADGEQTTVTFNAAGILTAT